MTNSSSRPSGSALPWVGVGTVALGLAYVLTMAGVDGQFAAWCMVGGIVGLTFGTVSLGALGRAALATRITAALCVAAGFGFALLSPFPTNRVLGVPLASVVMLVLVGLVPLVVLPAIFAAADRSADA